MTSANRCSVAILAGGMGTRLKARTNNLPKPMAPILGKPVLEYQIEQCRLHGFHHIALLVHYGSDVIQNYFGDGSAFGVALEYCVEKEARGTAGALRDALSIMDDRFFVLYGDTYMDVDLGLMWRRHVNASVAGTLLLHPNDHPYDSDLVQVDKRDRIVAIHPYPHSEGRVHRNLVNAALYILEREPLEAVIPETEKHDLAKHTFPVMLERGLMLQAHVTSEYIKDMGTPDRLDKVERDIICGLPEKLSNRRQKSAVFLDRDGTLNIEVGHLRDPSQLALLPDAGDAIRALNRSGMLAVCITNQPVVARGDVTEEGLEWIHAKLDYLLGESRAYLDKLYACPHHPDAGFPGEVAELKIKCECRKPHTGLIDRAVRDLSIDRRLSWMVGDSTADIEAGRRSGLRTVLVRTGHSGQDQKYVARPDYVVPDVAAAVDWILHGHAAVSRQLFEVCSSAVDGRLALVGGWARSGKSGVAQVLAELMSMTGRAVHLISLNDWLYSSGVSLRGELTPSCEEWGMALSTLQPFLVAKERHSLCVPEKYRNCRVHNDVEYSIGPEDFIIIEGNGALIDSPLLSHACIRLFVDTPDSTYRQSLDGSHELSMQAGIHATPFEQDAIRLIKNSLANANFYIVPYAKS